MYCPSQALTRRTDAPLALGLAPPTSADPNALSVFDSAYDRMPFVVSAHRLDDEQERCEQRATVRSPTLLFLCSPF